MALLGKAVLGVWNEVDPAIEADFNEWYLHEHVTERTSVPGMVRGRRYRAVEGSPRYMALYEATTMEVLTTGEYRRQLDHPTPWTQRVMAGFRIGQRGICDVIATAGQGIGGAATVIHMTVAPGRESDARAWLAAKVQALVGLTQVNAAHAWVASDSEPSSPTADLARRAGPDHRVEWVLAIEATVPEVLEAARSSVLSDDPPAYGITDIRPYPIYQLLFVLTPL